MASHCPTRFGLCTISPIEKQATQDQHIDQPGVMGTACHTQTPSYACDITIPAVMSISCLFRCRSPGSMLFLPAQALRERFVLGCPFSSFGSSGTGSPAAHFKMDCMSLGWLVIC